MKPHSHRNLAASVRARLKQRADEAGQDFNLTLTHYGLERLLYRLSVSEHANSFLLKGALLFALWYDTPHRPTRDVDLLGFGDAVTPVPQNVSYPVLLPEFAAPQLRAYPKATVVAEKLHAICILGMANTRMKDYFDLWVLLQDSALEAAELNRALVATFVRRGAALPSNTPAGLSDAFGADAAKQAQWRAFLKKNRLTDTPLPYLVASLRARFDALVNQLPA